METNTTPDSDSSSPEIQNESTPASPAPETAPVESPAAPESVPPVTDEVPEPPKEASASTEQLEIPGVAESSTKPVEEATPVAPSEPSATQSVETAPGGAEPQPESAPEEEGDPLQALARRSQAQRLSAADEERAATLLKEALLQGRAGIARAVQALNLLPWVVGVNAVTATWPEIKAISRNQLFAGLGKLEGDNAKRIRLSLARGLFKLDAPFALKIAVTVAKELREKETGAVSGKNAQIFANVLIGRAKPWIGQVSVAELKPADADVLVHCALMAAFSLPHAPITQLGVLKWATEAGKTAKLHPLVLEAATRNISRWSAKWQGALRKEVQGLPEEIVAVLKEPKAEPTREETGKKKGEAAETAQTPDVEADAEPAEAAKAPAATGEEPDGEAAAAAVTRDQPAPRQRPVYESKTVPRKPQQPQQQQPAGQQPASQPAKEGPQRLRETPIPELLRAVEAQFQSLRGDLQKAETKLRQKDEDLRRAQKKQTERASVPVIEGEPTPEELARLNRQLENRNHELQARIEELTADAEARAVSVGAVTDQPVEDPNAQLRTLLVLKLQEDYEDFAALEKESPAVVVQQHYRTVLRHVFEVLTNEGVQFRQ